MEALNKKIPENGETVSWLNSFRSQDLMFLTMFSAVIQVALSIGHYTSLFIVLSLFLAGLIIVKNYRVLGLSVAGAITILSIQNYAELINISGLFLLFYGLYYFFTFYSERLSYLILGVLAHMGDGLTTFLGLRKGFNEVNPFSNLIIEFHGYWTIFIVKSAILPILIYGYFNLEEEESLLLLKSAFLIGFYLLIRNTIVIY